jgi:hypothetical protein
LFVAVAYPFLYYTSADGVTWTQWSFTGFSPRTVCFGNGRFVAAQSGTAIYHSTTGTNWTRANSAMSFIGEVLGGVHGGGRFVLVGGSGLTWGSTMTSTDGVSWFTPAPPNQSLAFSLNGVTYGPGGYVAVGNASAYLYTSANGSNWILRSSPVSNLLFGVTQADGRYVAVGNLGQVAVSSNSVQWTSVTKQALSSDLNSVAWLNDRFVAVGNMGTVASSSNAVDWQSTRLTTMSSFKAATGGKGLFLVADDSPGLYTSSNALHWDPRSVDFAAEGLAFGNDVFVAVGKAGLIRSSTNGTNWTYRTAGITDNLQKVEFLNGRFWVVGAGGAVLDSTDGSNWNYRSLGWATSLEGITWLKDRYIAVALTGESYTSTNGLDWAEHRGGSLRMFHDVASNGRCAVAAGWNGIRYVTADGLDWTPVTLQARRNLTGVTFGNGTFVAVGAGGTILQSGPLIELELKRTPWPELTVTGPSGLACRLESAFVLGAETSWQTVGSLTLTNGTGQWPAPSDGSSRFYRAVTE